MCGIAGFIDPSGNNQAELERNVAMMVEQLKHRGPDDHGVWVDPPTGMALGHQRLAILDLSSQGRQPMNSPCRRYHLAYNGEIYNYEEIKSELVQSGESFQSASDTEVVLLAIRKWGFENALRRFSGMFALAVWDREEQVFYLARDSAGEKPLYYGWAGNQFVFASELKAFSKHPEFKKEINLDALSYYFRYGFIPAPYCIFEGIKKLEPATFLKLSLSDLKTKQFAIQSYWKSNLPQGLPLDQSEEALIDRLDVLLRKSVSRQMLASDVPLGAFLSGGIDSSLIVSAMQAQSARPVKTFTVGFSEEFFDEAIYAKKVANYLGTDHSEIYVSSEDARSIIPKLPQIYDEPFADISQIPTYLIAKFAKQHVSVCLSGDGADELFGGYRKVLWASDLWNSLSPMPVSVKWVLTQGLNLFTRDSFHKLYVNLSGRFSEKFKHFNLNDKVLKFVQALNAKNPTDIHESLYAWWNPEDVLMKGRNVPELFKSRSNKDKASADIQGMLDRERRYYLADDVLVKTDRASMAVSLEMRAPFLDKEVMSFAANLDDHLKIRNGEGKWLLKRLLGRYLPPGLYERPKAGFDVPMGAWLREPLKDWANDMMAAETLKKQGVLNSEAVHREWNKHLKGQQNLPYHLWSVLMWQTWLAEYFD